MPMSVKNRSIIFLVLFFTSLFSFQFLLRSSLYHQFLNHINGASYFYLTYDWQKKVYGLTEKDVDTIFIGSSRTAYSIDPRLIEKSSYNASLVAGSYSEMLKLAQSTKKKYSKVFIELNPMSASQRMIKMMSSAQNLSLFSELNSTPAVLKPILYNYELYLQRYILQDIIKSFFNNMNSNDDYRKIKRHLHVEEFRNIQDSSLRGYISGMQLPEIHRPRIVSECETMMRWTTNNPSDNKEGIKIFGDLISTFQSRSDQTIVWIPPTPVAHEYNEYEESLLADLITVAKNANVKIVDLRSLSQVKYFDCIHPAHESSSLITNALIKN